MTVIASIMDWVRCIISAEDITYRHAAGRRGGLLQKVERYADINNETEDQRAFYRAEEMFLHTCIEWMERTTDCIAEKLAAGNRSADRRQFAPDAGSQPTRHIGAADNAQGGLSVYQLVQYLWPQF